MRVPCGDIQSRYQVETSAGHRQARDVARPDLPSSLDYEFSRALNAGEWFAVAFASDLLLPLSECTAHLPILPVSEKATAEDGIVRKPIIVGEGTPKVDPRQT
jgi:hypothetical protein